MYIYLIAILLNIILKETWICLICNFQFVSVVRQDNPKVFWQSIFGAKRQNYAAFYSPLPTNCVENLGRGGCHTPTPCEHGTLYHFHGASSLSALSGWHTRPSNPWCTSWAQDWKGRDGIPEHLVTFLPAALALSCLWILLLVLSNSPKLCSRV